MIDNLNQDALSSGEHIVPIRGVNLWYHVKGSGQPLLFLPGGSGWGGDITPYIETLKLLEEARKVIYLEPRGIGRSQRLEDPSLYSMDEQVEDILEQKIAIVRKNLIKEVNKGIFPIIGYSYYEYANSLKEEDVYAALLYSEYALELSNLDMYFKRETSNIEFKQDFNVYFGVIFIFIGGIVIGFLVGTLYKRRKILKKRKRSKKRK